MVMARNSALDRAYAVILAGGSGTRFWPASRRQRPKQLLTGLFGPHTLLEQTARRIEPLLPPERTYVFTNTLLKGKIRRLLPQVPAGQVVAEPAARNTAPSLGLAAHEVLRRDPSGIMVVLPSDHLIAKPAAFQRALRAAVRWADAEARSVLIGLKPTTAHTGYGYIRRGSSAAKLRGEGVCRVASFTEKPSAAVAEKLLASGEYLWNGGMFVWRARTLLDNLERFQPEMARDLGRIAGAGGVRSRSALKRIYPQLEKISVDYAVVERAEEVYVIPADLGWSDVGSWSEAYALRPKDPAANVRPRRSLCFNSEGNLIVADRFVATVGVRDLVIVETADAILVADRHRAQDVGKMVGELERLKREDLL